MVRSVLRPYAKKLAQGEQGWEVVEEARIASKKDWTRGWE